ncbi:hypothetical protein Pla175_50510 [Pirellulimonas nuda]|uniref:Quinol:cytochrome C oxidoreductase n=1 Tax=Pirellulimonas nuda TaxID=2528009 RepID=A0A518DJG3_9BACT|nr:quinol:cytochrome C oxidoreductase [Pirellulimonas nuda]QDU91621.1 hypothetical protein Pla175_50510 [Pirellulimonas nuda]
MAEASVTTSRELRQAGADVTGWATGLFVLGVGLIAGAAAVSYSASNLPLFWHAYLLAASYYLTIALGGLFFVMAHHLMGGRWATVLRRLSELVAGTMPLFAVLFLPIAALVLMGDHQLYKWNDTALVAEDAVLAAKASWLNPTWFAIRLAIYFVCWVGLAWLFVGVSVRQDENGQVEPLRRLARYSGPGVLLFAITLNLASFDLFMSLSPHWFSSIFGVYIFSGAFLAFMSFLMLLVGRVQSRGMLTESITVDHRHDIAKLMFAFVIFWAYMAYSQYMLIWYANIPEETEWFAVRQNHGWVWVSLVLLFGHLLIPFLGFMSKAVRRNRAAMTFWAVWMLLMQLVDLFYLIMPSYSPDRVPLSGTELITMLLALAGVKMLFFAAILYQARGKWLLPIRDPRLAESLAFQEH